MLAKHLFFLMAAAAPLLADSASLLSCDQKEIFLREGVVSGAKTARKGITGTMRVTLTAGVITHDASVQRIDEEKARMELQKGTEIGFRDTYKFNIAAYKLGRMLGLEDMIPVSVERSYMGSRGAFTWWVDDFLMDEGDRKKKNMDAPDKDRWSKQYVIMQIFDLLIHNTDRNLGNILYDKNWNLWMIDHGRAFRRTPYLMAKPPEKCDRALLTAMKGLTKENLTKTIGGWVRPMEITGLLARRDKLVSFYEGRGSAGVYEYLKHAAAR